jgi:hypothetical protein
LFLLVFIGLSCLIGPYLIAHDPIKQNLSEALRRHRQRTLSEPTGWVAMSWSACCQAAAIRCCSV